MTVLRDSFPIVNEQYLEHLRYIELHIRLLASIILKQSLG